VRIGRNSRTLYLLDVRGSKFEVRFKARETEGSTRFEGAVQHRVKTAKMNVPVRNQSGKEWNRRKMGANTAGLSVCREISAGFELKISAVY
jgi:hypothetical protein